MTMTNAEWMIKNGYKFSDIQCCYELNKTVTFLRNGAIVGKATYDNTCLNTFKAWLDMEHKEPILDDAEKRYLSAVIRPFRKNVIYIRKYSGTYFGVNYECIEVCVEGDFVKESPFSFSLPAFNAGTMYKGMKTYKEYKLEELGL